MTDPASSSTAPITVRLFGRLSVVRGGVELDLGSAKQRSILAALALRPGTVVSTDALVDWVWPDGDAPGSPLTSIRSYVSNLRKILDGDHDGGVRIVSQAPGYLLEAEVRGAGDTGGAGEVAAIDVGVFRRHLGLAAAADNPAAEARHFDAALAIASRPLLPEFAYNEAASIEARAMGEQVLAAREARIELAFELGDHSDFVGELERMVAEHPLREKTTALLMRALYLAGRQADALAAFQRMRATLADELGLEPTDELRDLEARILRQDPTLHPDQRVVPATSAGADRRLDQADPAPTRRRPRAPQLVGRADELAGLADLLPDRRLVTLVGTGGVGKTSLAVAAADAAGESFPDGVVVVELAEVADDEGVMEATAEAIGAREQPELTLLDSIVNFLDERRLLLVLDNCEHVLTPIRALVTAIGEIDGPGIIATSRETLRVPGEQLFPVDPLDPRTHGVELFERRARERDPGFELTDESRGAVEQICERLDGVPLAIELAAARVRVMGPSDLLARLTDRFRVLPRGDRHGRSESLRDAVQWSYDLLDAPTARLFTRLAVFAGGFTLESATAVGSDDGAADLFDVLDLLTQLVDSSMVTSKTHDGRVRFGMLETLREFGREQLAEHERLDAVASRHADFFAQLVTDKSALLMSSKEPEVWLHLDEEWANVRLAFERKVDAGAYDDAVELALDLVWFSVFSTRLETFGWIDDLLSDDAAAGHAREVALIGASAVGGYLRLDDDAIATAERGLLLDPSDPGGYNRAALAAIYLNNVFAASDSDQLTQDWIGYVGEAEVENRLWAYGMRLFHLGSFEPGRDASHLLDVMVAMSTASESPSAEALTRWAEGIHLASQGHDLSESLAVWERGLEAARQLSPEHLLVELIDGLILYFTSPTGELSEVAESCHEALLRASNQHHLAAQSHLFGVAAVLLTRAGHADQGATLLGAMIGNGLRPRPLATHFVAQALGDACEAHLRSGHDLSIRDAGRLAIEAIGALR